MVPLVLPEACVDSPSIGDGELPPCDQLTNILILHTLPKTQLDARHGSSIDQQSIATKLVARIASVRR